MSFNPITNQPLTDYKTPAQIEQMKKEQDLNQNKLMELYNKDKDMDRERYLQMKTTQKEQNPVEYNPYKRPYSIYQGHP